MNLKMFPLENETDQGLLVRLMEECSEVIKECSKCIRTGPAYVPGLPDAVSNKTRLFEEFNDIELVLAALKQRKDYAS